MASSFDFFISGDHDAARRIVESTLQAQGFTLTSTPAGGLLAKRGSTAATFWLGALAGKNFQMTFIVEYFVDAEGLLVARLNRNLGSGALKGGAIGASRVSNTFKDLADALTSTLGGAGVLARNLANG